MSSALLTEGLVKDYAGVHALGPLDLAVESGEVVSLVGPNGAGKSTLLRLAAGLLEKSGGLIEVCGQRPGSLEARRLVSFVPDTPALYEDLSLGENVEFVARLHGDEAWAAHAQRLLERFGLSEREDQLPAHLSRGLRQRAALVLGLVRPFSLLLLDEPFGTLDTLAVEAVRDVILERAAAGAAVLVSSHQPDLLPSWRTVRLEEGRIVGGT